LTAADKTANPNCSADTMVLFCPCTKKIQHQTWIVLPTNPITELA
jgi:hypothetical protein